jgi:hypothetical protein
VLTSRRDIQRARGGGSEAGGGGGGGDEVEAGAGGVVEDDAVGESGLTGGGGGLTLRVGWSHAPAQTQAVLVCLIQPPALIHDPDALYVICLMPIELTVWCWCVPGRRLGLGLLGFRHVHR